LNKKAIIATSLIIVVTLGLATSTLAVLGQIGPQIEQIFPEDLTGVVGETVSVLGSIDTRNGKYEIYFGSTPVTNGAALDNSVSASFRIPETPVGEYTITLRDIQANSNATKSFTVNTAYSVEPTVPAAPGQLQEGSSVALNVTVSGGQPSTTYRANITVTLPAPLSTNYSRLVTLPVSSQKGTATTQVSFPDGSFEPSGALTVYAGSYKVYFNLTEPLASSQFTIGFTSLIEYHRGQTVEIRAIGYQASNVVTVTIKKQESGTTVHTADVTSTSAGEIVTEWNVPSDAAIGNYEVSIESQNTPKLVPDQQVISIPGYPITIRVLDLSDVAVPKIVVEALDEATNKVYDGTSGANGTASINLESGEHTLTAFWNDLEVGETSINVVGVGEFDISCELTNLRITVEDRNGLRIPSVNLAISYQYVTTKDSQQRTGSITGQTNVSGMFSVNSTPPGIAYTINASVYGVVFNEGNNTVSNLPAAPVSDLSILCPARTLAFKIIDYNRVAIPNARLELLELSAGIFYGATTDDDGSVTVEATFGKYMSRVYSGNVLLNETVTEAFTDKQVDIHCVLYNLPVSVMVTDYFGQPVPNANVRLTGPNGTVQSEKTQTNGKATFNRVIGGDMQVVAYLAEGDDYYEAKTVHVESPATIDIQMGRYVALGAVLIQTSLFLTLVIVLPVIAIFLLWEVFRRRKTKPKKGVMSVGNRG
jgi:hypothetical protein